MSFLLDIFTRPTRRLFLVALLTGVFIGGTPVGVLGSQTVGLAWNPSADIKLLGYNIYYGTQSGVYSFFLNVGNVTSAQIHGLDEGVTYYFAVSASDFMGHESGLSEEVSYTVPLPEPPVLQTQILTDENNQPNMLTILAADVGTGWWTVEYSTDLQTWNFYTTGYGSNVRVMAPLTDMTQTQKFFRLVKF